MKKQMKVTAALLLLSSIALLFWTSKRPSPLRKFDAIKTGMHSNEVVTLVGKPTAVLGPRGHWGRAISGDRWSYSYAMGLFSFTLRFTTNGVVEGTTYESPFESGGDFEIAPP